MEPMNQIIYIGVLLIVVLLVWAIVLLRKGTDDDGGGSSHYLREELRAGRKDASEAHRGLREELNENQKKNTDTLVKAVGELGKGQKNQLESVVNHLSQLNQANKEQLNILTETLERQLKSLQEGNEKKLDEMRKTVDEKLQGTLEKRLSESFKLVSDRLEAVQMGLGEMKTLASDVGGLKRVLSNVKSRGTWGEVQLGAILEQILTQDQFDRNVITREGGREHVEFAVRLPGRTDDPSSCVWLPIDSKFPQEDYQRLVDAAEEADVDGVQKATNALVRSIKNSAKDIREKYLNPPRTTDFSILFLPTEGLYAEVIRQPGLIDVLQREHRCVVAGPTTLTALLSSLRMGFQTLAIEQRSSEVWAVLGAVKTEFGKFGDVLGKLKDQLNRASRTIEKSEVRTRAMARKLRDVEQLQDSDAVELLGIPVEKEKE
jgi:DNA recombination protein RmuC